MHKVGNETGIWSDGDVQLVGAFSVRAEEAVPSTLGCFTRHSLTQNPQNMRYQGSPTQGGLGGRCKVDLLFEPEGSVAELHEASAEGKVSATVKMVPDKNRVTQLPYLGEVAIRLI